MRSQWTMLSSGVAALRVAEDVRVARFDLVVGVVRERSEREIGAVSR